MSIRSGLLVVATVLVLAAATVFLAAQQVTLGRATFQGPLNIAGGGSAGAPALILAGDSDTGLYQPAANQLAASAAGSQQLLLSSSGVTAPNGLTVSGGSVDFPAGAVAWGDVSKAGSAIADLATRSAADLDSGTLPDARLSGNVPLVGARVHTVCASGCDYATVASAIAGAASGDVIWIAPGTYAERATISTKDLTLFGYGATVAPASPNDSGVLTLSNSTVRILGLTITGAGNTSGTGGDDGLVVNSGTLFLQDASLTGGQATPDGTGDAGAGVLHNAGSVYVQDSTITGGDASASYSGGHGALVYAGTFTASGRTTISGGTGHSGSYGGGIGLGAGFDGVGQGVTNLYGPGVLVSGGDQGGSSSGSLAIELVATSQLKVRGARIAATSPGDNPAVYIWDNTTALEVYNATLIGAGAPSAAIQCPASTTVSVARSITNITPMTQATNCVNTITSPDNLEDSDIDW